MRKTTKSMLITALILFCAGLLLALSSALFVKIKKIDAFGTEKKTELIQTKTLSLAQILSDSPKSNYVKKLSKKEFSKIEIVSFAGDVVIKESSSETKLELDKTNVNNLSAEIIRETLIIKEEAPVGFMGFFIDENKISFQGLRHIFGIGNSINAEKTITLYVKDTVLPEEIDVISTVGDVTLDKVSAKKISIASDFGTVALKNSVKNADSKIKGEFSSVKLKNYKYTSCAIATKFGSVDAEVLDGENQSTVIDIWAGNVDLKTNLPIKHYKLDLSTSLGSIERNGKKEGKKLSETSSTNSRITIGILAGDVDLSFEGNEEDPDKKSPNDTFVDLQAKDQLI